jgi:negative regulator of flagellin synthesis FlgM
MKVSGKTGGVTPTPSMAGGVKPSAPAQSTATPAVSPAADDLSVSGSAQFLAAARAELAQVPDIRTEKVGAIRAMLESDGYHPDGDAVADGLVREHTPPPPATP